MQTRLAAITTIFLVATGCGGLDATGDETASLESITPPLGLGAHGAGPRAVHDFLYGHGYFENPELRRQFPRWMPAVATTPVPDRYDATLEAGVRPYQRLNALPETGAVDAPTLTSMKQPRCGYPDMDPTLQDQQQKFAYRMLLDAYHVSVRTISYGFIGGSWTDARKNAVKAALATWHRVTGLDFTENTTTPANASMKFQFGAIPSGVGCQSTALGCNDAHNGGAGIDYSTTTFNSSLTWSTATPPTGNDLQAVATHESGHGLGLDHSNVGQAVLFSSNATRRILTTDDTVGISLKYSGWETVPGTAWELAITADLTGTVYKMGTATRTGGYEVSVWNETSRTWSVAMTPGARHIAAAAGNDLYYSQQNNTVWRLRAGASTQLPTPSAPVGDIGVGAGRIWVLAGTPTTCGWTPFRLNTAGTTWENMGSGGCGWRISVDASGNAWVVDRNGAMKRYNGSGTSWTPGANNIASDIGVVASGDGVGAWISNWMSEDDNVPIRAWSAQGQSFQVPRFGVTGAYVAVGPFGRPWVLDVWEGQISRQRRYPPQ